jgi:predicted component of type VI protein secretion system
LRGLVRSTLKIGTVQMKVQLIVVKGKPEGKVIPLTGGSFKIGRGEACHLRPNSELVSREHTEVVVTDDRVIVRDLGSRNGTIVNGKALTKDHALKNGDLLVVGPLTFAVDIQGAPASVEAPRAPAAGARKAKPVSLEDVSNDEIEAWLVSDDAHTPPDRPSGVYKGDTQTFAAYKEGDKAKGAKPDPAPAKPGPAPAKPGPAAGRPAPPKPAPKPAEPEPEPEPEPQFDEDFNPFAQGPDDDAENEAATDEAEAPVEELIDESNPFHVKKPKPEAPPAAPSKPTYQDSASAANDILKRMMDRRRASK